MQTEDQAKQQLASAEAIHALKDEVASESSVEERLHALQILWATREATPLFGDFNFIRLTMEELSPLMKVFGEMIFGPTVTLNVNATLSEAAREARKGLAARLSD